MIRRSRIPASGTGGLSPVVLRDRLHGCAPAIGPGGTTDNSPAFPTPGASTELEPRPVGTPEPGLQSCGPRKARRIIPTHIANRFHAVLFQERDKFLFKTSLAMMLLLRSDVCNRVSFCENPTVKARPRGFRCPYGTSLIVGARIPASGTGRLSSAVPPGTCAWVRPRQ